MACCTAPQHLCACQDEGHTQRLHAHARAVLQRTTLLCSDPAKVAKAYTLDTRWRNRVEFINNRAEAQAFLQRKWCKELDYRLIKELWAVDGHRLAVRCAAALLMRLLAYKHHAACARHACLPSRCNLGKQSALCWASATMLRAPHVCSPWSAQRCCNDDVMPPQGTCTCAQVAKHRLMC